MTQFLDSQIQEAKTLGEIIRQQFENGSGQRMNQMHPVRIVAFKFDNPGFDFSFITGRLEGVHSPFGEVKTPGGV